MLVTFWNISHAVSDILELCGLFILIVSDTFGSIIPTPRVPVAFLGLCFQTFLVRLQSKNRHLGVLVFPVVDWDSVGYVPGTGYRPIMTLYCIFGYDRWMDDDCWSGVNGLIKKKYILEK